MKTKQLRILLIGYGKMGRAIEQLALSKGHIIVAIVSDRHTDIANVCHAYQPNIAFEFTSPSSAVRNLEILIQSGIPVVCGSTGWMESWDHISDLAKLQKGSLFYASNFSMGMNLMFKLTEVAARFMNHLKEYEVQVEEIHHIEKKDMPSGTALTLTNRLIANMDHKKIWELNAPSSGNKIGISCLREPNVPGTHLVTFSSAIDTIEISHTAHSRNGFAAGALMAGEWLLTKKGVFGMEDLIGEMFLD
ncbi:MAG TPA: 4-hydroxy-tetrahydrodipicolinate reductase [Catalimonadaceae bacterium]|nr:4-hydroxy-tetrahydrodipicolinate reductase [Catalimonadaceae bacterium]